MSKNMSNHNIISDSLSLLGLKGKDRVTGFEGTVSTVGFDLYGCVQVVLTPGIDKDGKPREGNWFDVKRIQFDGERVMDAPNFEETMPGNEIGAAEKPLPR